MRNTQPSEDLIVGAAAIAEHLGVRKDQVEEMAARGELPTFIGASKSSLHAWLADSEANRQMINALRTPE